MGRHTVNMFHRNRLRSTLAALLPATALLGGLGAATALADPSFKVVNRSGLGSTDAKFYYLGFGTIGSNFVVLGKDGKWITAGDTGSGWQPTGYNSNTQANSGAGVVPCYPLVSTSTVSIPPNIAGARVYFFQVNKGTALFNKPCNATVPPTGSTTYGIFGNTITTTNGGQAPFSYFSTSAANGGLLSGASLAQLKAGLLPVWTYSEVAAGATQGTIDTSQVDFVGFPMNVTAKAIPNPGKSIPLPKMGVGFSFSDKSQVDASSILSNYDSFVAKLPETSKTGTSHVATRASYKNLVQKMPGGTILVNPGNYINFINPKSFPNFFANIIDNYMWKPGWRGGINIGSAFGTAPNILPPVTFVGTAMKLASYNGYSLPNIYAIKFTANTSNGPLSAYLLSPTSYQALCKAGAIAGCSAKTPAYQVFATDGALNTPPDLNQFGLLTPAEQAMWNTYYSGSTNYNAIVGRLGLIVSMAFNHGIAGGLQTPGGACAGQLLSACWSNQALWFPNPATVKDPTKRYFTGDTTQNEFARWLHTAMIGGVPMMTRPTEAIATGSGVMSMGYGFASDENPTPPNNRWAQTPSKYDNVVSFAASTGCNFITIMPAGGTRPNPSPVTNCR